MKIFQVSILILEEVVVCLDLFFRQKKCLYKWEERKRSSTIFVKIPYTNSASVSGVAEKIDKFFTLVPEGRSIDTSIVVNFFHPMISDNFPSLRSCRDCFWIITSSSINITMINPKSSLFCLVSFAPPIVKSVSAVSRQSLGSLSAVSRQSLGSEIHQFPFPIREYFNLLLTRFNDYLFWFKTTCAETERPCEREKENLKGRSKTLSSAKEKKCLPLFFWRRYSRSAWICLFCVAWLFNPNRSKEVTQICFDDVHHCLGCGLCDTSMLLFLWMSQRKDFFLHILTKNWLFLFFHQHTSCSVSFALARLTI